MMILTESLPPHRVASQVWLSYAKAGAGALVLGAAFGGGLLFGDKGSASPPPPTTTGALAAADDGTERLAAVQDKLRLAFHKELVGEPHTIPTKGEGEGPLHAPRPAPKAPASEPQAAAEPVDDKGAEGSAGTEPPPAAPVKAPPPAPPRADADDAPAAAADDDDEGEEMTAPTARETAEDRTRVARALAKVLGSDAAIPPAAAPAPSTSAFALQLASTPSEEGARALVEKLRAAGHKAVVTRADVEGKGAMYRVRVPGFTSREAASAYQQKVAASGHGSGYVVVE